MHLVKTKAGEIKAVGEPAEAELCTTSKSAAFQ
jgi:hypothetical protein